MGINIIDRLDRWGCFFDRRITASGRKRMTKAQKVIVLAAAGLTTIIWLFPPYWEGEVDDRGDLTGVHLKWEFNKHLRDLINPPYHTNPDGSKSLGIWEYTTAEDVQGIEFLFVLVIAGAAGSIGKAKTKTPKAIIIASASLIVFTLTFPPFYLKLTNGIWINAGWKFIVNLVGHPTSVPKIRFDVLGLEILGFLALAGAALLITKKR